MRIDESLRMRSHKICMHARRLSCILFCCGFPCRAAAGGSEPQETFVQVKRCFSQQEQRNQPFQTESRPAWVPAAPAMRSFFFYHSFEDNQRVDAVVSGFQKRSAAFGESEREGSPICEIGYLNERRILGATRKRCCEVLT